MSDTDHEQFRLGNNHLPNHLVNSGDLGEVKIISETNTEDVEEGIQQTAKGINSHVSRSELHKECELGTNITRALTVRRGRDSDTYDSPNKEGDNSKTDRGEYKENQETTQAKVLCPTTGGQSNQERVPTRTGTTNLQTGACCTTASKLYHQEPSYTNRGTNNLTRARVYLKAQEQVRRLSSGQAVNRAYEVWPKTQIKKTSKAYTDNPTFVEPVWEDTPRQKPPHIWRNTWRDPPAHSCNAILVQALPNIQKVATARPLPNTASAPQHPRARRSSSVHPDRGSASQQGAQRQTTTPCEGLNADQELLLGRSVFQLVKQIITATIGTPSETRHEGEEENKDPGQYSEKVGPEYLHIPCESDIEKVNETISEENKDLDDLLGRKIAKAVCMCGNVLTWDMRRSDYHKNINSDMLCAYCVCGKEMYVMEHQA